MHWLMEFVRQNGYFWQWHKQLMVSFDVLPSGIKMTQLYGIDDWRKNFLDMTSYDGHRHCQKCDNLVGISFN